VALAMSHIASAFPTAGSLYHWSERLGGKDWGWCTGWINILGLLFVTAAINVGAYQLLAGFLNDWLGIDLSPYGDLAQFLGVALLSVSQAIINHHGIRTVGRLAAANIYVVSLSAIILGIALIYYAGDIDLGRLIRFTNFSGPAGGDTWPAQSGMVQLFLLSLLLPGYTITGFDASAHASEETLRAANEMPRALLISVIVSALFGYFMVASFVLAMPDMAAGAAQGGNVVGWLVRQTLPGWLAAPLMLLIVIANYLCGLAAMTSTSRMVFAFARGGHAPWASWLRKVSARPRARSGSRPFWSCWRLPTARPIRCWPRPR
jgi:amino acid transporter